ncbi:porin [Variovorax sp. PDNC026]|uniref:porin n=1 Tax=Variovorax sp. PDNC026 TaxID=2811425 RepID=UPI0019652EE7|nr:porin [Variovorax sp. PDNC026]QRY31849.1 porin [Variovorax sp. PDNC026]
MKRISFGLLALCAAGIAAAQSSLTMFGVADAGISYYSASSRNALTGASVKQSQWALSSGGNATSRIGFRGTEDLGGGLAASFWLEAAVNLDNGTVGVSGVTSGTNLSTLFFNRRSTVSLSGPFGEFRLGRDYNPTFYNDTVFDPFGTNGVGSNLLFTLHSGAPLNDVNYIRASNAISYYLPGNLGGFYGFAMYGFPENTRVSGPFGARTDDRSGRYWGVRMGYARGPLDVAGAYGVSKASDTLALEREVKTANLAGSYDFGVAKAFAEISRVRDESTAGLASFTNRYDGMLIGVSVPVGASLIRASYAAVRYKADQPLAFGDEPRISKLSIGYTYNLSKRTALYATVARVRNRNDPFYNGRLASAALTAGGAPTYLTTAGMQARTATGYDFGIRHAF